MANVSFPGIETLQEKEVESALNDVHSWFLEHKAKNLSACATYDLPDSKFPKFKILLYNNE